MAKIILSKKNYFDNLSLICAKANSMDKVAVVLKDNAYGHGLLEIAKMANEFGIKKAIVRNCDEAEKIEKLFNEILVLTPNDIHTYSHAFHMTINNLSDINKTRENTRVHLKVDTGMHRNGILPSELEAAIHGIVERNLIFTGVFTHHRSADKLSSEFFWQRRQFEDIKKEVKKLCEQLSLELPSFHSCNSAALFRHANFNEDWVRVGIAQFGYLETPEIFEKPALKPVMSLWANKISQRSLKKGQRVGYGATYEMKESMTVGCYDLGYGDGFLRLNEKQAYYTPQGHRVLGRVSMDNLSLDTNEENVCIFDNVHTLAKLHNTISYEITTALNPNIPKEIR